MQSLAAVSLCVSLLAGPATAVPAAGPAFLVTGAGGRTGSMVYKELKNKGLSVRASVYSLDAKTKAALGCTKCDASEGVYVGDVTQPKTLTAAMEGVQTVLCAVGAFDGANATEQQAIEFTGVENQVAALAQANPGVPPAKLKFVLCSSMGTTDPHPKPYEGGPVLFWKLNAEAFLANSGLTTVVVKPGGLVDGPAGNATLVTGHDDSLLATVNPPIVTRADVAAVMVAAALHVAGGSFPLRFGLVSKPGKPTSDLVALLEEAKWPWQQQQVAA